MSSKPLVIVESPTKAKTLGQFLAGEYEVVASVGHVRDLPKSKLGVDVEAGFAPQYVIPPKARPVIKELKKKADQAESIYLATDFDREGEAIAWHITQVLDLGNSNSQVPNNKEVRRITFHEITKTAIADALKDPRTIDERLVNAQQARRVLDRLVGYKLSPFLWKKVTKGLSAGRVQSVALRLIVERERAIEVFVPVEYWLLGAALKRTEVELTFPAYLIEFEGEKIEKLSVGSAEKAETILRSLEDARFTVDKTETSESIRKPLPPFITSTLQQEASTKLGFSASRTMRAAQKLYEEGLITYLRTDSTQVSAEALTQTRTLITAEFGKEYLPGEPNRYVSKVRGAQEAHEAIHPTDLSVRADGLDRERDEAKLYRLIWLRMVASQMMPARYTEQRAEIVAGKGRLLARGRTLIFDGFLKVYGAEANGDEGTSELPALETGQQLVFAEWIKEQKFTEPPARFSEASLIRALEKEGIGRPSTYAPIMYALTERGYTTREGRTLKPTELGVMVAELLVTHFPEVMDLKFTARMEEELDDIAEGKLRWQAVIEEFYQPFAEQLKVKLEEVKKTDSLKTLERACPKCGKPLVERMSRYGRFIGCSGYPDCDYKETTKEKKPLVTTGLPCPECQEGEIVERVTRKRGKKFWGCSRFPKCKFATWEQPKGISPPPNVPAEQGRNESGSA